MEFILLRLIGISIIIFCFSCSSIRHVIPLEPGESRISASIGGPITLVGDYYIPVPFLTLGYNYGLKHNLDLEAGFKITDELFGASIGVTAIDAGVNYHVFTDCKFRPGLYLSLKGMLTTQFKKENTRFFPLIDFGCYWHPSKRNYIYLGMENWIELHTQRYDGNPQENHILLNPYIGYILQNKKWLFQLEGRAVTINCTNKGRAPKNIGFGDQGIIGVYIGISREFGAGK